jgi:hypothetical protein
VRSGGDWRVCVSTRESCYELREVVQRAERAVEAVDGLVVRWPSRDPQASPTQSPHSHAPSPSLVLDVLEVPKVQGPYTTNVFTNRHVQMGRHWAALTPFVPPLEGLASVGPPICFRPGNNAYASAPICVVVC